MSLHVNDGGVWKEPTPHVNDAGIWKLVKEWWVNDAGTWKKIFNSFGVTGGTTGVYGSNSRLGAGSVTATTSSASAGVINGGTAPYTYAWEYVSGDTAVASSAASANTSFSRSVSVAAFETISKSGVYRCKITDSTGAITYGPMCSVDTDHSESS